MIAASMSENGMSARPEAPRNSIEKNGPSLRADAK